jgi:hypothetical protein
VWQTCEDAGASEQKRAFANYKQPLCLAGANDAGADEMPAPSEAGSIGALALDAERQWLGHSLWQAPPLEISGVKSWGGITVMTYHRGDGESVWRGDRHRIGLVLDPLPSAVVQIGEGPNRQGPVAPGTLTFFPADLEVRVVHSATRLLQVLWDTDLYSALLPEVEAAASRFEFLYPLHDLLLSQIVTTLAQEVEDGFADRILVESLGTALCIRQARHFVGRLPLPTGGSLSPERLQRVGDYVETHLDDDLSLIVLADIACLTLCPLLPLSIWERRGGENWMDRMETSPAA